MELDDSAAPASEEHQAAPQRSSHTSDLPRTDDLPPAKIYLSDLVKLYHCVPQDFPSTSIPNLRPGEAKAPATSPPPMADAPLSAAADAAHLSSTGAWGDEDMETRQTQCASPAEEENDENTEPWITVTKRARRRGQQPRSTTPPLPLPPLKPALHESRPKVRKPRLPPLPADDFKLAIRPRNGLQLNEVTPGKLVDAIAFAAQLQIGATEFKRIAAPGYEALTCRRLGNTTTMVITFLGNQVPYCIELSGILIRCYLYKRTVPHCRTCHEIGHRADVCPRPPGHAQVQREITRRQPNPALKRFLSPVNRPETAEAPGEPPAVPQARQLPIPGILWTALSVPPVPVPHAAWRCPRKERFHTPSRFQASDSVAEPGALTFQDPRPRSLRECQEARPGSSAGHTAGSKRKGP
ncbi:hypothetical protein IscW_ISCW018005 [Ixodes scapularis]|uniref:CCHC-type domain-containing protein n=1 Tax=Ixodes scapularis TaxID=6945 RepID=B7PG00_IXOSC|nr:hypothetical protein IscW_ISCW018005 [Ixodes scapularis]|eukprot:XP_002434122.1 hypothetical protein IscW_ISCW018005 [Ixodes scapularis]